MILIEFLLDDSWQPTRFMEFFFFFFTGFFRCSRINWDQLKAAYEV